MKNILMNTEMTKAILDGRKMQTRRVIKARTDINKQEWIDTLISDYSKYRIGETIWVREPAEIIAYDNETYELCYRYKADDGINAKSIIIPDRFLQKLSLPKWISNCQGVPNGCISEMARIFLKITNVRVERLKDISYIDTMAEGCDLDISDCVKYEGQEQEEAVSYSVYCWYRDLWNKTAPKGYKWEDNPYVFVYEFERVER